MRIALILAAIGGVITFAVKTTAKIEWLPWLNIHAAGLVMFIVGIFFALAYTTPHYHRWRGREDD
jgi:hypothetical protein